MLSAADSLMWDALEIGPQWILRETEDVTPVSYTHLTLPTN
mgnify:CR=1 FL=1